VETGPPVNARAFTGNLGRVRAAGGDVRAALVAEYAKAAATDATGLRAVTEKAIDMYDLAVSVDDIAQEAALEEGT
jgi:hypothetical protein